MYPSISALLDYVWNLMTTGVIATIVPMMLTALLMHLAGYPDTVEVWTLINIAFGELLVYALMTMVLICALARSRLQGIE